MTIEKNTTTTTTTTKPATGKTKPATGKTKPATGKTKPVTETIHVPTFGVDVNIIFSPIASQIKCNAHGAFMMRLMRVYPNAVSINDLVDWQCEFAVDKYPSTDSTARKRARGNVMAHVANVNGKSKTATFPECGLRLRKTVDGWKLVPIE